MACENTRCWLWSQLLSSLKRRIKVPVLLGPTASGKSTLALNVACELDLDIISCDSRQIYRGMDIGTAKSSKHDLRRVKHWLIDVADPSETYSAFRFSQEAAGILQRLAEQGRGALICGGAGLYYRSLSRGMGPRIPSDLSIRAELSAVALDKGPAALHRRLAALDPESAKRIHANDTVRLIRALEVVAITGVPRSALLGRTAAPDEFAFCEIVLERSRDDLYRRINERVDTMAASGLWDEFLSLRRAGFTEDSPGMLCLGYHELFAVEQKQRDYSGALGDIKQHTRKYAKRQMTWFRTQIEAGHIDMTSDQSAVVLTTFRRFLER
jgi:tRNA dimethylallyltransferase